MKHSKDCREALARHLESEANYWARWPNHCKSCGGWGGFWEEYDPSPSGVALSPGTMTDFFTCPDCIDEGKCPRCGKEVFNVDETLDVPEICPHCEFNIANPQEGVVDPPECLCYLLYEDDEYGRG